MDLRLNNAAVFQIVGPSGCGKTIFVTQLLSNSAQFFLNKINKVYWLMRDSYVRKMKKYLKI